MDGESFELEKLETKQCNKCKEIKSIEEFHNHKRYEDGLYKTCKSCVYLQQEKHRISGRRRHLMYGITLIQQQEIFNNQGGLCAICKVKLNFRKAHLDHVKNSNPVQIRGFLCVKCNQGLGHFDHNVVLFSIAIEYLNKLPVLEGRKNIPRLKTPYKQYKTNNSSSKYLGVIKFNNKKWRANFRSNGKRIHIGLFDYEEQAALAYDNFVRDNLPLGSTLNNIPLDWQPPTITIDPEI